MMRFAALAVMAVTVSQANGEPSPYRGQGTRSIFGDMQARAIAADPGRRRRESPAVLR